LTPTEFREQYEAWSKIASPNDSDIIPDKPRVAKASRHAGMCADLRSMLAWREMKESKDPLQTNFLQAGFDDDIFLYDYNVGHSKAVVVRDPDRELNERPSAEEIMDAVNDVVFQIRGDGRTVPVYDQSVINIELGEEYKSSHFANETMRPITRLGHLRFSNRLGDAIYPRGALLPRKRPYKKPVQKGLSDRFLPPPENQRFNPLERLIAMEEAAFANDNVSSAHAQVLDLVMTAKNFTVVGETLGFTGKTAERQGKRLVQESAKGFSETLKRLAA
jgi:hypothetical protein